MAPGHDAKPMMTTIAGHGSRGLAAFTANVPISVYSPVFLDPGMLPPKALARCSWHVCGAAVLAALIAK